MEEGTRERRVVLVLGPEDLVSCDPQIPCYFCQNPLAASCRNRKTHLKYMEILKEL